jgi:hypothetical protein
LHSRRWPEERSFDQSWSFATQQMPHTIPFLMPVDESFDVGVDNRANAVVRSDENKVRGSISGGKD